MIFYSNTSGNVFNMSGMRMKNLSLLKNKIYKILLYFIEKVKSGKKEGVEFYYNIARKIAHFLCKRAVNLD